MVVRWSTLDVLVSTFYNKEMSVLYALYKAYTVAAKTLVKEVNQLSAIVGGKMSAMMILYFAMNSNNMKIDDLKLDGNYSFDGCRNVEIRNSNLLSKDAFWNTENVTVYDSFISGEYLGWNAKNLTLVNCTIESLQGMCYIDNLVMKNCKLINTTLAFEYSTVDADICSKIDSVMNPTSGTIKAQHIDNLIIEKDKVDPSKTKIIVQD